MVMACGAIGGKPKPDPRSRRYPIIGVYRKVFFFDRASFVRAHGTSMETRGNQLSACRVRQQVARELLDCKLIERLILIKRRYDPIPVWPHLAIIIEMIAMSVRIPCHVQPVTGPMFTPLR